MKSYPANILILEEGGEGKYSVQAAMYVFHDALLFTIVHWKTVENDKMEFTQINFRNFKNLKK